MKWLMRTIAWLAYLLLFMLLTVVTQVGGIILLISSLLAYWLWRRHPSGYRLRLKKIGLFVGTYLLAALVFVPVLAPYFGRQPLPIRPAAEYPIRPANWFYVLANRHYVTPSLHQFMREQSTAFRQKYPEATLVYLDANFPFWNGFPLIPHLSHDDGEKLDLAFVYRHKETGQLLNGGLGILGYGVPESPLQGEANQAAICRQNGHWQYDIMSRLLPQAAKKHYRFDLDMNRDLLRSLVWSKTCGKVFLEPHLKARLGLQSESKIRFHGCHSVRHDDHIHLQL